ncbi:hypothetical protein GWK18_01395 [Kocuria sp. JC486]|uniref:hypothetical protein n=1 Tax=Kocuria sp. JC486 TaxID=1970736 RepID=UPI001422CCA5|nr:hypothetical protein [Kocuria sp. JC486]NHU84267.1 hypothetical protein [Kocuria sp. JC486]
MSILTRSRKAAAAAAVAGSLFISGGLATAAIAPSIGATPSPTTSSSVVEAEPGVFVSLLCQAFGRCSR